MNMPQNGTPAEIEVREMTNARLAQVLDLSTYANRKEAITEAIRRLRWEDAYDKHR